MAVSGYSPNSIAGIAWPKGPKTYKVKLTLWIEVEADDADDVANMSVAKLLKEGKVVDSDPEEPEEVW